MTTSVESSGVYVIAYPHLYAVGNLLGSSVFSPVYWKDAVLKPLTNGTYSSAVACSILGTPGGDVYVGGYGNIGSTGSGAVYWKNNVIQNLPNLSSYNWPLSAAKDSIGNVFFGGTIVGNRWVGAYWGIPSATQLPSSGADGSAGYGIAVSSTGDIYVTGYLSYNTYPAGTNHPGYWKNGGGFIQLSSQNEVAGAICISSGDHVYVTGYGYEGGYWKDGAWQRLSPGSALACVATGITVVAGDVYVSGHTLSGGSYTPAYWKNGSLTILPTGSAPSAQALGIAVEGNDVDVVGELLSSGGAAMGAVYWKSGTLNTLPIGSATTGYIGTLGPVGIELGLSTLFLAKN